MKKKEAKGSRKKHAESEHALIKRHGTNEAYDERKVYGSVYGACMSVEMGEKQCELISAGVAKKVTKLVHGKKIKTSGEIAKHTAAELRKKNKDAAFMYETHRDIS